MKTAKEVQGDVMRLLNDSLLAEAVTGKIYRSSAGGESSYRPRDSRLEDIVVIFTRGFTGEIQSGVVTVNIFYNDIDAAKNGVYLEDGKRGAQLQRLADEWVQSLTADKTNYIFSLQNVIDSFPDKERQQHFVYLSLEYKYYERQH